MAGKTSFEWLVTLWPDAVFTVFDTETTGLEAATNRIVEIGGIRFDRKGIISRFNSLINPEMAMPAEASRVNGITDAMLKGQPVAATVIPDFLRFAGNSILIAHNAPFDMGFLNAELYRLGKPSLSNKVIDTIPLTKELYPGKPKYALQSLAADFGITALDAHRAEDDARVCMELFLVCVNKLLGGTTPQNEAPPNGTPPTRTESSIPAPQLFLDEDELYDEYQEEENFD